MRTRIDFNDESLPIGKRKQAFVGWAIHNGYSLIAAQKEANDRFGFERKGKYALFVNDMGRMCQYSFGGIDEIVSVAGLDIRKIEQYKVFSAPDCDYTSDVETKKEYKAKGFIIKDVWLIP